MHLILLAILALASVTEEPSTDLPTPADLLSIKDGTFLVEHTARLDALSDSINVIADSVYGAGDPEAPAIMSFYTNLTHARMFIFNAQTFAQCAVGCDCADICCPGFQGNLQFAQIRYTLLEGRLSRLENEAVVGLGRRSLDVLAQMIDILTNTVEVDCPEVDFGNPAGRG